MNETKVVLRKKAPYFCRSQDSSGKLRHLSHALAESEGDLCAQHEAEAKAVREKFFGTPTSNPEKSWTRPSGRTGPVWP